MADSTSSWRTLNSSEQFQQILTDQGLLDDANLFDLWVNEAVESGYSNDAGTIAEVQGEVNEMEDALAEYASMMADSPENAEAAAAYAKERAEKLGADVAVASGTNAAAIGDTSTFIDDVAPLDAETDGAPNDKTLWAVPLLPYQTILTAEGIFTDEASAVRYEAGGRFDALVARMRPFLSGLYEWRLSLAPDGGERGVRGSDLGVTGYRVLTGRRIRPAPG